MPCVARHFVLLHKTSLSVSLSLLRCPVCALPTMRLRCTQTAATRSSRSSRFQRRSYRSHRQARFACLSVFTDFRGAKAANRQNANFDGWRILFCSSSIVFGRRKSLFRKVFCLFCGFWGAVRQILQIAYGNFVQGNKILIFIIIRIDKKDYTL